MRIGLCWNAGDDWIAHELRPSITKMSAEPAVNAPAWDVHRVARLRDDLDTRGFANCELVIDLRTVSVQDFLAHPLRGGPRADVYEWFVDWVGEVVANAAGCVTDWELWGEAGCPYTGKGFVEADGRALYEGMTYVELLRRVYQRIHEVQPGARVLLGGHGCDMALRFYEQVVEAGGGAHFDCNNLHPFVLRYRDWGAIEVMLREGFDRMRGLAVAAGVTPHPLVATEFGWPVRDGTAEVMFESHVLTHVVPVGEEQAAEWTQRCFELFEAQGMEYIILVQAQIGLAGQHWGHALGVVGRTGQKRPALWNVVQDWMEKGR